MEFGWINVFHIFILILILLPNIIFAKTCRFSNEGIPKGIIVFENIGRYGAMILMIFPIFAGKFGYPSVYAMLVSLLVNIILAAAYNILWIFFSKRKSRSEAIFLAVLPALIFLVSGLTLRHWALVIISLVFGICHIYITNHNTKYNNSLS